MLDYIEKITPILRELDERPSLNRPVGVEADLIPLFKRHSGFSEIEIVPIPLSKIAGFHLGQSESGRAIIFSRRCESHTEMDPACPACQWHRLIAAKELVHVLDTKKMRTPPNQLAENIIDQLINNSYHSNIQSWADGTALLWAVELLIRFQHRVLLIRMPHSAIKTAQASNDWTYIARQYGIPAGAAEVAFSDSRMDAMRAVREKAGLPVGIPSIAEWDGPGN